MGSQGIPTMVAGARNYKKSGFRRSMRGDLSRFRLQVMHNTLILLVCVYLVFLDLLQSVQGPKSANPLTVRCGPPFIVKGAATVAHRRWKVVQWSSLSSDIMGQNTLNVILRCPLALSGMVTKSVPFVAASPCSDTRPGQQGMHHHVGW